MRKFNNAKIQAVYDQFSSHNPPTEPLYLVEQYQNGLAGRREGSRHRGDPTLSFAAYIAGRDKWTKLFGEPTEPEQAIDNIYDMINKLAPSVALSALTATIMGTVERCENPHRALLAVIAELTNLLRFSEHGATGGKNGTVQALDDWIDDTWK